MLRTSEEILARLAEMGIDVVVHRHPPVLTVEEAQLHTAHLPGGHCKNLFLKDKKGRLWLVTCRDERRVDLNRLSRELGAARFSFGKGELLEATLGVTPGSVTPLAIVNDEVGAVTHVIDRGLLACATVNCHPMQNDATVAIGTDDLLRLIRATSHEPLLHDFDDA